MTDPTPDQTKALEHLDAATARYTAAAQALETAREELHRAIVTTLSVGVGPSEVARHAPYDRNHVDRLRRKAGISSKR